MIGVKGMEWWRLGRGLALVPVLGMCWLLVGCVTTVEGVRQQPADRAERVEAHLALARGYIEEGDWDDARRPLERALEIDARSSEAHALFALLYQNEGENERAESHYQRALRFDRHNSQALNNYGIFLFQEGRFDEARERFARAASDTGYRARASAYENLGITELELGEQDRATAAFERALELDPQRVRAHLELADLNLERGNVAAARDHYASFSEHARHDARSLWLAIRIHRAMNDRDAVASYALQLRNLFPGSEEYRLYQERYE